jgi:4'-phosphopantetheinyl transferase
MWTVKEAYTKALGLGMGFEFSRVEFDAVQRQIRIDGKAATGWKFILFTILDGDNPYEGVAAEFVGGDESEVQDEVAKDCSSWLTVVDALSVLQRAVDELPSILS